MLMERVVNGSKKLRKILGATGIVGTGRVGSALARRLSRSGVQLVLYDVQEDKARSLGAELKAHVVSSPGEVAEVSDTVFVATRDDQIRAVAEALTGAGGRVRLAVHLSGSRSSEELEPLARMGVSVGSLHPAQTFRGSEDDWQLFDGCTFAIEGDDRAIPVLEELVRELGGRPVRIASNAKALYHAACVAASNFLVTLWNLAERLTVQCGLTPGEARVLLRPLVSRTVENLVQVGPLLGLTGPFARGDAETVRRHVEALNRRVGVRERRLYRELARATLDVARDAGLLTRDDEDHLMEALRDLDVVAPDVETDAFLLYPEDPSEN